MAVIRDELVDHRSAFFSYARRDDRNEEERITDLRGRLEKEVQIQTGEDFSIFQDKEDISLGQQWRERTKTLITKSVLFIAVVTPTYLKRCHCREEVRLFTKRERQLGRSDLIIPVRYVPTPGLTQAEDDVARTLASRQYFPWEDLRFYERDSRDVREAIGAVAEGMIGAMGRLAEAR